METSQRGREGTAWGKFPGIDHLMDYFRLPPASFSPDVENLEQAVQQLNQEGKLLLVPTLLEGDWYRTAVGPFLVEDEAGISRAVLPDGWGRYYCKDEATGKRMYLGKKNPGKFPKAYSAGVDFARDRLSLPTLFSRLCRGISPRAGVLLALLGFLGGALWVLFADLVRRALSSVMLLADVAALGKLWLVLMAVALLLGLLVFTGRRICRRAGDKGAVLTLPALARRLYEGAGQLEPGAGAALAGFRENSRRWMSWMLSFGWSLCALAVMAPFLQGKTLGWALLTAAALFLLAAFRFFRSRRGSGEQQEERLQQWFLSRARDRRLGVERPFPGEGVRRQRQRLPGGSFWAVMLLSLPVVAWTAAAGYSVGRLVQGVLLYLPFSALPLQQLLQAGEAGRAMGAIGCLLPLAEKAPGGQVPLPPLGSAMEWKDVTFAYPGSSAPVLRGVSLRLNPGERVGIWGGTGGGKTTFCRLASGLMRPTGGNIYYGGVELARYNGAALRSRVAWQEGRDIVLGDRLPPEKDRRTWVILSSRPEDLAGCDRLFRLEEGRLILEEEEEIG